MTVELSRHVARVAGAAQRILEVCPFVGDVDRRRVLLDAAGELLAAALELLRTHEPGDGGLQVLALVRQIARDHVTLSRECEGQLRERARVNGS